MRVAVIGSGGVGGFVGGMLARTGHDVAFLARGEHLQALRRRGLRVHSTNGDFDLPTVRATDRVDELGQADLFLFTVKTYDGATVAASLRPLIAPGATILTLQNGIDNHEVIDRALGMDIALPGTIRIETRVAEPGVIAHTSKGYAIRFGEVTDDGPRSERVERLHAAFVEGGLKVAIPDDMRAELWDKFLFIVPFAGLTTLARAPIGPILAVPELARVLESLYVEAAAVANAAGVDLGDDPAGRTMANVRKLHSDFKSSMQRDLERGKPLEVDALLGALARIGRDHGIPTPTTDCVYGVLQLEDLRARREAPALS